MFEVVWRTPAHAAFTWKYKDFPTQEEADGFAEEIKKAAALLRLDVFVKSQSKNPSIKTLEEINGVMVERIP
jgi:hypothetical protein